MRARQAVLVAVGWVALAGAALAQPQPSDDDPSPLAIPGGDLFGFTSPSDVGNPGDKGVAVETTIRLGKRGRGTYVSPTLKTQFSATVAPDVALALSPFVTGHRIREVPGLTEETGDSVAGSSLTGGIEGTEGETAEGSLSRTIRRSQVRFDGLSGEASYRFIARSATNPFAATLSVEPRWARVDALTGGRVEAYATEAKFFSDAVIVPDRLYGALNLNYAFATQRPLEVPDSKWESSSGTTLSAALTYQVIERFFLGVEARYLTAFSGIFLNRFAGQALFAGPNLLLKFSDSTALNLAWTPQLVGKADDVGDRRLDLENFERHQFRVKLATSF